MFAIYTEGAFPVVILRGRVCPRTQSIEIKRIAFVNKRKYACPDKRLGSLLGFTLRYVALIERVRL